jgi:hypothetical protein
LRLNEVLFFIPDLITKIILCFTKQYDVFTEDGFDPNELFEDLEGQSALHAAAAVGSLSIVHVLIQVNMYLTC